MVSSTSTATSISTQEIQQIVEKLKNQRHRSSTQRNYYLVWKNFNKFYLKQDKKPSTWSERLTLFVTYLIDNERQSSTVRSYISAIKAVLLTDGHKLDQDEFLLSSLTRACHIKNDKVTTRLLIGRGMLSILLRRIEKTYMELNQTYLAKLFTTIICTAYFGLFRVSELVWTKSRHAALAKDVQIGTNKRKFLFILRLSKTHHAGSKPQLVKICNTKNKHKTYQEKSLPLPCPFQLLRDYAKIRPPYVIDSDQFFVLSDGSKVTATLLNV